LHRDWHFKWHSFNDRDRSVHYNWIWVIDRDFNLNGVGFWDSNWDSDRVRLWLRDGYRDLNRVRVVKTDWDFHRVRSVNGDPDFNREGVRDRDFLQNGIGPVYWHRDADAHRIGIRDFHGLLDDFLPRVEAAKMLAGVAQTVAVSGKTPFRGTAVLRRRSCLDRVLRGEALRNDVGTRDGGQAEDEYAQLWEKTRRKKWVTTFRKAHQ
jgi:hypothetical protein